MSEISLKWKLSLKALELVTIILLVKIIAEFFEVQFLTLNSLFGAIISANVFLIGFLITGVLTDYKESEKLPNEIAMGLEALTDEVSILYKKDKSKKLAINILNHISNLTTSIHKWFYREVRTAKIFSLITDINDYFPQLETLMLPISLARMKQEQTNIRKVINRIHTIRETSFNPSGYAIAEIITGMLCVAMIFTKIDPWYEGLFFVGFVSFMTIYMVIFIKDLDNPFGYYNHNNLSENISLNSIDEVVQRIQEKILTHR